MLNYIRTCLLFLTLYPQTWRILKFLTLTDSSFIFTCIVHLRMNVINKETFYKEENVLFRAGQFHIGAVSKAEEGAHGVHEASDPGAGEGVPAEKLPDETEAL